MIGRAAGLLLRLPSLRRTRVPGKIDLRPRHSAHGVLDLARFAHSDTSFRHKGRRLVPAVRLCCCVSRSFAFRQATRRPRSRRTQSTQRPCSQQHTPNFTNGLPERKRYENPGGDMMETGDASGQ